MWALLLSFSESTVGRVDHRRSTSSKALSSWLYPTPEHPIAQDNSIPSARDRYFNVKSYRLAQERCEDVDAFPRTFATRRRRSNRVKQSWQPIKITTRYWQTDDRYIQMQDQQRISNLSTFRLVAHTHTQNVTDDPRDEPLQCCSILSVTTFTTFKKNEWNEINGLSWYFQVRTEEEGGGRRPARL